LYQYKAKNIYETIGYLLILLSVSFILIVVFFPFPTDANKISFMIQNGLGNKNNIIPGKSILNYIVNAFYGDLGQLIYQFLGNIILFIPFGFAISLYFREHDSNIKSALLLSFIFSLLIEILQLIFGLLLGYYYRSADIDDVILNVFGGLIGYIIFIFICPKNSRK
jgi:glycopeptide antibiotics resistance protein